MIDPELIGTVPRKHVDQMVQHRIPFDHRRQAVGIPEAVPYLVRLFLFYFLDLVEEVYHQKPLLYTFRNFYNRHLQGKIDDYPLMIAMYTDEPPVLADDRDYTMWQYTAKGRIVGINGFVDKSRFMGRHTLRDIRFKHH